MGFRFPLPVSPSGVTSPSVLSLGGWPLGSGKGSMRIIDRYLGGQVLSSTLFAVFVLSIVLVLGNVFKEILPLLVNADLPLPFVLKFVALVLPFSLIFTIPWGLLSAVLLVFGRISADNELVSLRMAGLSMPRICLPIFAVAVGFSLVCFYINASVSPRAKSEMKRMFASLAVDNPLTLFREDSVTKDFPGYIFYVTEKEGDLLKNLQLVELDGKRPVKYISSPEARVIIEPGAESFDMVLSDANVEWRDVDDPDSLQKIRHGVTFGEMHISISLEKLMARKTTYNASTKETHVLMREARTAVDEDTGLEIPVDKMSALKTEISRRNAFSLACFTFALVGIPLGVTAQRRETTVGFALSLVVACCYFLVISLADTLRDNPKFYPHLLMWVPSVVFLLLGAFLFRRLSQK